MFLISHYLFFSNIIFKIDVLQHKYTETNNNNYGPVNNLIHNGHKA